MVLQIRLYKLCLLTGRLIESRQQCITYFLNKKYVLAKNMLILTAYKYKYSGHIYSGPLSSGSLNLVREKTNTYENTKNT